MTESRILFEIDENPGCTASHIVKTINIDKSYLSRILKSYEDKGCLTKIPLETDRRSYGLYLTDDGRRITEEINRTVDDQMRKLAAHLTEEEWKRVEDAMDTITLLFGKKQ